ncbi:MAG: hypothetical protein Sylvanvirus16_1 [Sylvanvirus sp.]|uniref:Uncharacterized protein n=1 Tax=Sylvanvirus sp. TaxID=2487774 RepID=A0A3G5AIF6_9VIRU|nr:MAG: hypothetical protein Sylvanvirus16_1 [Sylvanvirus sp.]
MSYTVHIHEVKNENATTNNPNFTYEWMSYLNQKDVEKHEKIACIKVGRKDLKMADFVMKAPYLIE